ncbi:MAG: DNA polymerase IV [Gammaproteobacteria bacterium]|nr:MAG: DNA polymerase IV [Gammaproteobacteria bacterium]RLA13847.1 MAG: DNA polymerase IV [Gammaproteobacteria bacterium]
MNSVSLSTLIKRKIIHVDMDCFFAAVEMLDNPELVGKAIAVGGDPLTRGVIATCSYEARKFGIHSAMASARAVTLCPHLQILPPRIARYREVSTQIRAIFAEFTQIIEPLSLDEAYLDVTDCRAHQGSATRIAQAIRAQIHQQTGLTASAGIGPNKMLAKVASDWNKPDGQFVVTPAEVDDFVRLLPVSKLFGVGKVTGEKLHRAGIETCGDLQAWSETQLQQQFGRFGSRLHQLCRGIDQRPLETDRQRKSVSVERTFADDRADLQSCLLELPQLLTKLQRRLEDSPAVAAKSITTLVMKIKFSDFAQTTIQQAGDKPNLDSYTALLKQGLNRRRKAVRLLGLGVRFGDGHAIDGNQMDLPI